MHSNSDSLVRRSISAKLLKVVFTIYLTVAVVVMCLQMVAEYIETKNGVFQDLNILQKAFERSVAASVWYMDVAILDSTMRGMLEHPVVVGVRIRSDNDELFVLRKRSERSAGEAEDMLERRRVSTEEADDDSSLIEHAFTLLHIAEDGEEYLVGNASIYSSYYIILRRVQWKLLLILLASIVNIVAFWVIVLLVGKRMLSRPLSIMAEGAGQIALDNLENVHIDIHSRDRDELKILEEAFNGMVRKLLSARTQLYEYANELHRSRQQFQDVIDNAAAVIFVKDLDGRYLLTNRLFESSFHFSKTDTIGRTDWDFFPKESADVFREHDLRVIASNAPLEVEEHALHDDVLHTYLSIKFPLHDADGAIYAVCGIATDISERKKAEELLKHFSQTLQQEVEQRTRELNIAKDEALVARDEAEDANRAKSLFLANMSHELRTPLNAILGFSQLLSQRTISPNEQQEFLGTILRNGEHLLALIDDVLELSKIEANRVELLAKDFDLVLLLTQLEDTFRLRAERKELTLTCEHAADLPPFIRADQDKLRQVLINLLGNAIKYTEEGEILFSVRSAQLSVDSDQVPLSSKQLTVTSDRTVRESEHVSGERRSLNADNCLVFTVKDTGIGIASEHLPYIFEAFVRVNEDRYNQGTGLGLPIARKYVRMMGGDIRVESASGQGTRFSFTLPLERAEQAENNTQKALHSRKVLGVEPGQRDAEDREYCLLIVEDNDDSRLLLGHLLRSMGLHVYEARNGDEAVTMWEAWQPQLIWMDMRMPLMDGYEATRRIRELETRPPVIIALTAFAFEEDRKKVLEAGCDDFVRKPFREAEISEMLHKHLGLRFVYDEEVFPTGKTQQSTSETRVMKEALDALPAEWLTALETEVTKADITMLRRLVTQIRERDAALAEALTRLIDDFDYDEILRLLQNV